ncbi:MAG: NAD(+)/NADH kinase [Balneolales bacterium]|nr:NAD(+)/NADH kinase [Balneolales bacterium]
MQISLLADPKQAERVQAASVIRSRLITMGNTVHLSTKLAKACGINGGIVHEKEADAINSSEVVITIGGDGTLLRAAQMISKANIPVLGINYGKLGFLADTQMEDVDHALQQLCSGKWTTQKRQMLKADFGEHSLLALNEFVFAKQEGVSMITLEVFCDGQKINKYWADGLIIATPTGSTAYNLSAGGPILHPETDVMVITPICAHALTLRPLVLPASSQISVVPSPGKHQILFSNDGKICDLQVPVNTPFAITKSSKHIQLIQLLESNYFETLRNKLMWGIDLRE